MNRLQIQKSGGGQAAFDFLTAEDKDNFAGSNGDHQDTGFRASQHAALNDLTEVLPFHTTANVSIIQNINKI